jgi:hypothetical protein
MPRYLVERTFAEGLHIPTDAAGARACAKIVSANADFGVTWLHSYVAPDSAKTYCIYDAPSPEDIAEAQRFAVEAVREREPPLLPSPALEADENI